MSATKTLDLKAARLHERIIPHVAEHAGLDVIVVAPDDVVLPEALAETLGPSTARELAAAIGKTHGTGRFKIPTADEAATAAPSALPPGTRNPFAKASFNLTEQVVMRRENPQLAALLKAQADAQR